MDECGYHFDASFWQMRIMDAPCYVPTGGARRIFYTAEELYCGDEYFGFHPMVCVRN